MTEYPEEADLYHDMAKCESCDRTWAYDELDEAGICPECRAETTHLEQLRSDHRFDVV